MIARLHCTIPFSLLCPTILRHSNDYFIFRIHMYFFYRGRLINRRNGFSNVRMVMGACTLHLCFVLIGSVGSGRQRGHGSSDR